MLIIRFQRVGRKNRAFFRLVLAEKHRAASKLAVEVLGHYDPHSKELGIKNADRLQHWLKEGVAVSATVHNLLVNKGVITGAKKVQAWKPKPKTKGPEDTAPTPATAAPETPPSPETVPT